MDWIKKKLVDGDLVAGTFLNLGVGCSAEIAGRAGLDWVLIDTEHGLAGQSSLVSYIQSARVGSVSPIVRVIANQAEYFKRALDLGAAGIMVPQINTADEARLAVEYLKYPPEGVRGLTRTSWSSGFGFEAKEYITNANDNLLLVIQIETKKALDNVEQIAAVDGVDVLFVGPSDLSCNLSMPCDLNHPELWDAISKITAAAEKYGKKTGILIKDPNDLEKVVAAGFKLVAMNTDLSMVRAGLQNISDSFKEYK